MIAVRSLTGETLWTRGDIQPGSEIFGDDEMLFVVEPNSNEAIVLRALDGHELGRRPVPPAAAARDQLWAARPELVVGSRKSRDATHGLVGSEGSLGEAV